jgi:DNA invertase Pin-like site-specific DNA recombinase
MKAVIYARTTAINQVDNKQNIAKQLAYLEEYCKQENLSVTGRYFDIGSGKNHDSIGWRELLLELDKGQLKVKRLVCTTSDNYSRRLMKTMQLIQGLNKRGIQIIFLEQDAKEVANSSNNKK